VSDGLRILVAVDKYKGCLGAGDVARHLGSGLSAALPTAEIRLHPVSDGGDGFCTELVPHGFTLHTAAVTDPLGRPAEAAFALGHGSAVIEMATSSGLAMLSPTELAPLRADTVGLGMLIRAALVHRPERIVIGAGGSATSDGGAGALAALGMLPYATVDPVLHGYGPQMLLHLTDVDLARLTVGGTRLQVATDVTNPLLGPQGAAAVFGPQKGATPADVATIERALTTWADVLEPAAGRRLRDIARGGAAGGLAFGLATALGAELIDGIDTFAGLSGLADAVAWADVVITGEGSMDSQTTSGKAPMGVLRYARAAGVPCWAVVGRSGLTQSEVSDLGFVDHVALTDHADDESSSIRHAPRWLQHVGEHVGSHFRANEVSAPLGARLVR
jgi:glycerate kinase